MSLTIKVDSTDRTNDVDFDSFRKTDNLYNQADILEFAVKSYGSEGFTPSTGESVTVTLDSTKIFSGVIINVTKTAPHDNHVRYEVRAKSEEHFLDRELVLETYSNTTVESIISDLVSTYASNFSTNNVQANINVDSARFNRIPMTEAIDKLSEKTNFKWYVDYDKDIHFNDDVSELAPFNITDDSDNKIFDTIEIQKDFSQVRNRVTVRGGEFEGNSTDENFTGDGSQTKFRLAYKYSTVPTVKVDGTTQDVGKDFLSSGKDVFWDKQQQRIRFDTAPSDGSSITVEGKPLIPILVQVEDNTSINNNGVYEHFIEDKTIETRDEAIERAKAEIQAYAQDTTEGSFRTYTDGLESGQQINIDSTALSEDTDFIIKQVSTRVRRPSGNMVYDVQLQTARTRNILDVLQNQIFDEALDVGQDQLITSYLQLDDSASASDTLSSPITTTAPYYWEPVNNNSPGGEWNFSTWE